MWMLVHNALELFIGVNFGKYGAVSSMSAEYAQCRTLVPSRESLQF